MNEAAESGRVHTPLSRRRRTRRAPPGATPGTLIPDAEAHQTQIHVFRYGPEAIDERDPGPADLAALGSEFPVTWINVDGLGDLDAIRALGERYGLHNLALEDVVSVHQRPKAEDHDAYLFVVARMPTPDAHNGVETEQIAFFLGDDFLITFQERPGDCFDPVRARLRDGRGRLRAEGPDYLMYALLDAMTDSFFPILESYGDKVDDLNDLVLERIEDVSPAEVHRLRRDLLTLRRAIWPLREMFGTLVREQKPHLGQTAVFYLRDCYDHAVQLLDLVETYREIASGSVELYMSGINNRMNEIMKVLTVIATIFIPLSFIASLYGMNFDPTVSPWNMPELKWVYGYPFVLALMAAVTVGLLFWFRWRGWLGRGGRRRRRR